MMRTAHYVASTHWDREWYEPFQGFRMRLVSLLDEAIQTLQRDPAFATFVADGQTIPVHDYLEIRPEAEATLRGLVAGGRLKLGPWYVLPDEWLVSGESLVRNLQLGIALAEPLGGASRAGFVCDEFGHTGQLPQIFAQMGIPMAFVWRGTHERDHGGHFTWRAPDGTAIPVYRFGRNGYSTFAFAVRQALDRDQPFDPEKAVASLVEHTLHEAGRSKLGPILLFDGGDHVEIEPGMSRIIAQANEKLAEHGIRIIHSDLDRYAAEVLKETAKIDKTLTGELREPGREFKTDEQWLIPGVLSSRVRLKQMNSACEDELCLWAEPFSAFAAGSLGAEWPAGYLRAAWRHLLENHPHDSICGCSIDQVHQDMVYRFDQSLGISSRLAGAALRSIALAAAPAQRPEKSLVLTVFNPTAQAIDEPVDLDIPLPPDWPGKFKEFFGYEDKYTFTLTDAEGRQTPWQLVGQQRMPGFRRPRYKFPTSAPRHIISVTAPLRVPAMGYTTLVVRPAEAPIRHLGSMADSEGNIQNEWLRVKVNPNGSIDLTDQRTGRTFERLLTFDDCADIGDGWYHGLAVNDQVFTSAASAAEVAVVANGPEKATVRIAVSLRVPAGFDFAAMVRSPEMVTLRITSDLTLRRGADRLEVVSTVENNALDHRLRVLAPTHLSGDVYWADAAFDVVQRPVKLLDNSTRRELDVETRPQQSWTAFGDGKTGLAVVSRGLYESAVRDTPDRAIALTLLRSFRRAVYSGDNPGGQSQGTHAFRYAIVPFAGAAPAGKLAILAQRLQGPTRLVSLSDADIPSGHKPTLPAAQSLLDVEGDVVVTSVQRQGDQLLVRCYNPTEKEQAVKIAAPAPWRKARLVTLAGAEDQSTPVKLAKGAARLAVAPKRIVTIALT